MSLAIWILRRISWRHWRAAPGQTALLVLSLGLGVAAFVSVRLANRAAVASFQGFTDALSGPSDWVIEAPAGTLPESVLSEVRRELGRRPVAIAPVVETTAVLAKPWPPPAGSAPGAAMGAPTRPAGAGETFPEAGSTAGPEADLMGAGERTYTLLGLDLVGIANLAAGKGEGATFVTAAARRGRVSDQEDFWGSFRGGAAVWVPPALAQRPSLRLVIEDQVVDLPVAGAIPVAPGAPDPPAGLLVVDLPRLQVLAHKAGRLDRIEFLVAPGPQRENRVEEVGARLTELGRKGGRWTVRSPGARRATAETMTEAFRLNLTILSLVALLVGLYLIFQGIDGAVVRRRGEMAILRSLGMDEWVVRRAWLIEAAGLGLAGGVLGLGLGWAGAQGAVRAVGRTVNALYYATTVDSATLQSAEAALALALGAVAGVAAGWWPAREAARTPPAQILLRAGAPELGAAPWRVPWLGGLLVVAGAGLSRLPPWRLAHGLRFPAGGYAAALAWILGGGILCACALPVVGSWMRRLTGPSAPARVAASHLRHASGRHRLAAAALVCAVGMCAGMGILVASFERTVTGWVARSLTADLYLSSAGSVSASAESRIAPATVQALAAHPGVDEATSLAVFPVDLGDGAPALLSGTALARARARADFPWAETPVDGAIFDPERNQDLALVSESFAERFGRHRGDALLLPTPTGPRRLRVAGVFADYGNERGSILVEQRWLARWMDDASVAHVSLFLRPGIDPDAVRARLGREFPGLRIFTNRTLRSEILRVFRQTFSITYALEVIGVVVAVAGLALALTSLLLDRREELNTLRALGFARRDLALAAACEGLAVAVGAAAGGLALSLGLGWLLIRVINKQSFGWTLQLALPWEGLAALAAAVAVTGAAASYAVGFWGSSLEAEREE
jgi:putative ABC transport system permease protein